MTRGSVYSLLVAGAVFGATACSSSNNNGVDASFPTLDSGIVFVDAGMIDAGTTDAGKTDAGMGDAGMIDAGPGDAGSDAGMADAGDAGVEDAGTDAGMADGGCDDFSGFYIPDMTAMCTNGSGVSPPVVACVSQTGCNLTVTTDQATYTGTAQGSMANLTTSINLSGVTAQETCTGTKTGDMVTLDCQLNAGSISVMCTIPATKQMNPQNASSVCCDPTAMQSTCMNNDRCTFTVPAGSEAAVSACLPSQGMVMEGGDCTRAGGAGGADPGYDNCADGLFCTRDTLSATSSRVCRKICKNATECTTGGQACVTLFSVPARGICEPTCTYFGTDCPADTTCRPAQTIDNNGSHVNSQTCSTNGTVAIGATCTKQTDCGEGAGCFGSGTSGFACRALCDMTHACTTMGETCQPLSNQSDATLGFCAP